MLNPCIRSIKHKLLKVRYPPVPWLIWTLNLEVQVGAPALVRAFR